MSINIFTDGAASKGKRNSACEAGKAGYGVYSPELNLHISLPLTTPPFTNQRAELSAMLEALRALDRNLPTEFLDDVRIYCDSMYTIKSLTEWRENWERNGFMNAKGKPVANQDILLPLFTAWDALVYKPEIHFVRAHTRYTDAISRGNEEADRLAVAARRK